MELQYGSNKIWMENEAGTVVAEVDFVEREDGNYDIVIPLSTTVCAAKVPLANSSRPQPTKSGGVIKKRPPAAPTPTPGSAVTKTNRIYLDNQDENLLDLSTFHITSLSLA